MNVRCQPVSSLLDFTNGETFMLYARNYTNQLVLSGANVMTYMSHIVIRNFPKVYTIFGSAHENAKIISCENLLHNVCIDVNTGLNFSHLTTFCVNCENDVGKY